MLLEAVDLTSQLGTLDIVEIELVQIELDMFKALWKKLVS